MLRCVVCVVVVVVLLVVVVCVWCVCCGTLKKRGKPVFGFKKRLRAYIQNVSVNAGTTRACVETCARGAGTHGDVFERTHGDVLNPHGEQGVIVSSAYQNLPTYGYHVLQRFIVRTD